MKREKTTSFYSRLGVKEDHTNVNRFVKGVVVNFEDGRGDIIVYNDNFGTRRKYADFTNGKKRAGLHPMQIVFCGIDHEHEFGGRYVDKNDNVKYF